MANTLAEVSGDPFADDEPAAPAPPAPEPEPVTVVEPKPEGLVHIVCTSHRNPWTDTKKLAYREKVWVTQAVADALYKNEQAEIIA